MIKEISACILSLILGSILTIMAYTPVINNYEDKMEGLRMTKENLNILLIVKLREAEINIEELRSKQSMCGEVLSHLGLEDKLAMGDGE